MKKDINKLFFLIAIILSLSIGFLNFERDNDHTLNSNLKTSAAPTTIPFIYGTRYLPFSIDPQDCLDLYSHDVLNQIMETLFTYDFSDPNLPVIPLLASSYGTWDITETEYTLDLRTGITFHDGSFFDADDVIFTFNRMAWLYNFTGLNSGYVPDAYRLYVFPNGTPIIKEVIKLDSNTIKFVLNDVFAPFEDLLCHITSSILTDTYYSYSYVELSDDVVGTGPFVFDNYQERKEVNMHAFNDYWRGKASIDELVVKDIRDDNARNNELLTGTIHFLKDPLWSMLDTFKANPNLNVLDEGENGTRISYLGMNNRQINVTFREAISYAINYSFIIDELTNGNSVRLKSALPMTLKYANWSLDVPILNLTRARLVMQSMGYGAGFNIYNDTEWVNQWYTSPFATFNCTYNIAKDLPEDIFNLLINNLAKIGIRVTDSYYTPYYLFPKNRLRLFWTGWTPYYNDPSCILSFLFTNRSVDDKYDWVVQYNGWLAAIEAEDDPRDINNNVQLLMEAALIEKDSAKRERMYDKIQGLLVERDYAVAWGIVDKLIHVHHINLTGFQQSALRWIYFYPCQWTLYDHVKPKTKIPGFPLIFFIWGTILGLLYIFKNIFNVDEFERT